MKCPCGCGPIKKSELREGLRYHQLTRRERHLVIMGVFPATLGNRKKKRKVIFV
jgi:hypothetical protein